MKRLYPFLGSDFVVPTCDCYQETTKRTWNQREAWLRGTGARRRSFTAVFVLISCCLAAALSGCSASYTVSASGLGSFHASTGTLDFGTVAVGQTAVSSLTLLNQGSVAVEVSQLQISGGDFAVANPTSLPFSVAPNGGTYNVTVQFKPQGTGNLTGKLTISDTSSTSPTLTVNLQGQGATASSGSSGISVSSLSCGQSSMTGAGSDVCTVKLSAAAGTGGLAVSLASNNSAVTVPASITVPAGATSASFTAAVSTVETAQNATLTASGGGATKTYTISLSAATPQLTLNATSVTFGAVLLNSLATQQVTLTSSGTAPLTISTGSVTGAEFSLSGVSFPVTLNPGQTATLNIGFNPTVTGTATGTVTLTSNAASAGTVTISLSGTGTSSSHQVNLTWNAPTSSADPVVGYNVYRAAGGSSYQLLNTSVDATTAYTDISVLSGASYSYYVESVDAVGNQSAPSNIFTVSIP